MSCRSVGCGGRRSGKTGQSKTFNRTGPTTLIGNSTRTFGRTATVRSGGTKTIQTSSIVGHRNNMPTGADRAACCPPAPVPKACRPCPPCPAPPSCGIESPRSSFCVGFGSQADLGLFTQSFGPQGGSAAVSGGRLFLAAEPGVGNFAQVVGNGTIVDPATDAWCLCFDVHSALIDAFRSWQAGFRAADPLAAADPSVLVLPVVGAGGIVVNFQGTVGFSSPAYPVSSFSGLHRVRLCHVQEAPSADPKNFTLSVDGGAELAFQVPAAAVPAVALPPTMFVLPAAADASAAADFGSYCLQTR